MVSDRSSYHLAPSGTPYSGIRLASPALPWGSRIPTRLDIADFILFLSCIWLACGLGHYIRLGGSHLVAAMSAVWLMYIALRFSPPPKWLAVYMAVCVAVAILSYFRFFPPSWQVYFRSDAIARQIAPAVIFFIVAWASKAYFQRRLPSGDAFFGAGLTIFLSLVVAQIVLFQQGFQYEGLDTFVSLFIMYGSFTNNIAIAMFFITAGALAGSGWRRWIGIIILFMMLASTSLAQFWIAMAAILAILVGVPGRAVALGVVLGLAGLTIVGLGFIPQMMQLSPNSGIRLAFIANALESVSDTYGLGIGYGTESVKARYNFPGMQEFILLPDPADITPERMLEVLSTGVHNSFVQTLMRTGVLGFGLFVIAFFAAFPPRHVPRNLRNHASILFVIVFVSCFVNTALESPTQSIGIGFLYGYLIALRRYAGPVPSLPASPSAA
jgi:hypothetical protein